MIKGKSAEEIRRTFNITNDFTPEEEAQIKKENVSFLIVIYVYITVYTDIFIRNGLRTVKLVKDIFTIKKKTNNNLYFYCKSNYILLSWV
jgi:hypothetical protein